ncbi:MAG: hypothetical protein E7060_03270 [Treponema bryantii]|nr:hypothetical protein [Treponema bryantii]
MIFFAAFIYVAQMGLMQHLETKFYSSAKISEKQQYVDKIAKSSESYISNILTKIETGDTAYLKQESVKSYIEQNPSEKAEIDRRNLTTKLIEDIPSLTGIRLIDINGRNIHYSSFEKDVLNQNGIKKQYKNYPDIQNEFNELEISTILSDSNLPQRKILFDKKQNRLIMSFPFFISNDVCFASLVCYFDLLMYEQFLVEKEIIPFGENLTLVDNENLFGGYVIGIPKNNRTEFIKPILDNWTNQQTNKTLPTMILESNDLSWYLLNSSQNPYFNISSVYDNTTFEISKELEYLIYTCVFVTLLVIFFLFFSLFPDNLNTTKKRISKLQLSLIKEFLEKKDDVNWETVGKRLEIKKQEFAKAIKKSFGKKSKKYLKQIDEYIDESWDQIITLLNVHTPQMNQQNVTSSEIRAMLEEVLKTTTLNVQNTNTQTSNVQYETIESLDDIIDSAEEVSLIPQENSAEEELDDFIDDTEELVEDAEELLDEPELVEEAEELLDEPELVEEAEELLDEPELVEETEELLDEAELVEEAEELLDEPELVEEAEELLDEPELVEEAEELLDEPELVEEAEELLDEPELVEEAEELLDEPELVEEAEELLDEPELEEAEELLDEPELIEDAEELLDEPELIEDAEELLDEPELEEAEELLDEPELIEDAEELLDEPELEEIEELDDIDELEEENFVEEFSHEDTLGTSERLKEELFIGSEKTEESTAVRKDFNFTAKKPSFLNLKNSPIQEEELELEELLDTEQKPSYNFTMFASPKKHLEILPEADPDTIIEKNGIFTISDKVVYKDVVLDSAFKDLVDSVLNN